MRYLKKASRSAGAEDAEITAAVAKILRDVENGGEKAARSTIGRAISSSRRPIVNAQQRVCRRT
jgi:hypothetical protein